MFLIINAALGAGLLNFPKAFDTAGGVLVAVVVQVRDFFLDYVFLEFLKYFYCLKVQLQPNRL